MRSFSSASSHHCCATVLRRTSNKSPLVATSRPFINTSSPLALFYPTPASAVFLNGVISSMAPKRKKSTAALPVADPPPPPDDFLSPDSAQGPRRSGRQRRTNDAKAMATSKVSLRQQPQPTNGLNMKPIDGNDWNLKRPGADVKQAIKDLNDMDERLQSNTKRQRRAIEDSRLTCNGSRLEEKAISNVTKNPKRAIVNDRIKEEEGEPKFPSPQKIEAAPMANGQAAEVAEWLQEDAADAEPEGQNASFERGATRPPPVNSDYLPLPWKGRLGYVSSLSLPLREFCKTDASVRHASTRTCERPHLQSSAHGLAG